jgi:hypothetical protein
LARQFLFRYVAVAAIAIFGQVPRGESAGAERDYVIACHDAGAGGYEAFPDLCRLPDGELLCVFYAGFAHVSLPAYAPGGTLPATCANAGRVCLVRSRDNGRTWSAPTIVVDTPLDDRDPSIARLPDGTLLCNYFSHRPGRKGRAFEFVHSALVRSTDGGRTWSAEQELFTTWACSSPIRRHSDGRLALALYQVGPTDQAGCGGISFSTDKGRTWSDPVAIGKEVAAKLDAEPDIIELPGARLLAGLRPAPSVDSMAFSWSTDRGRSWSKPDFIGFPAHCVYFLLTSKNILLMGHRIPGTSLHYSLDFGKSWSENVRISDSGGAYPSMVELADGSIQMVFYEEGPQSDIRSMRFTVNRDDPKVIKIVPPSEWK